MSERRLDGARQRAGSERFLVTGAYGCIGAWTLRQLVDEGVDVVAADASTDDHRVTALLDEDERSRVRFVQADISKPEEVQRLFDEHRPTHVIHLAALQVPFCRADPIRGAQVNVVGTVAIFAAAMQARLEAPIVYASSAAAFAAADAGLDPSGHPETHYGVYKLANEESARVFFAENGVSSIGLRPYVVYGPGRDQGLTSQPTMAMRAAAQSEAYTIGYTGVTQLQYGADAAAAFVAAARSSYEGATVVNLPGVTASVDDIVEEILRVVPDAQIDVEGSPLPFPPELDTTAFAGIAGDVPVRSLADGVAATIEHFR
jgi:nucleoside-diphosphate-sugar epimerase